MASQHNRTSSYRALIEGNKTVAETREEFLHKKVMGDEPAERKPHGLPPPEVLNEELKTMKVDSRAKSSIAGASSSTFHIYRQNRREVCSPITTLGCASPEATAGCIPQRANALSYFLKCLLGVQPHNTLVSLGKLPARLRGWLREEATNIASDESI